MIWPSSAILSKAQSKKFRIQEFFDEKFWIPIIQGQHNIIQVEYMHSSKQGSMESSANQIDTYSGCLKEKHWRSWDAE